MIADIASGNHEFADVMFLIAVIFGVLSTITSYSAQASKHALPLLALAVTSASLAWLVL